MVQTTRIDFTTIRSYLTDPCWHEIESWEFAETNHDNRAIGVMLAALSKLMLPYWQARYRHDEKMEQLTQRIEAWAVAPSPKTQLALFDHFQSMSVEIYPDGYKFLSMPSNMVSPKPTKFRYPGDMAGDSIYHAARHIVMLRTGEYDAQFPGSPIGYSDLDWNDQNGFCYDFAKSKDRAIDAVSQTMEHRNRDDDATDHWMLAHEHVRVMLLETLASWHPEIAWNASG